MTPRSRLIILSLALIGLAFAASSTWVHYKLMTDATYTSPCDMTATFNCSQAYLSQYGSLGGVPVAIGGAAWFALVAAIAFFARPDKTSAAGSYIYVLSTVALAFVLYLGYASFAVLQTACILCIGTYASVIGIFIVAGSTTRIPMGQLPSRLGRDLSDAMKNPAALVAAIAILASTGALAAMFPAEGTRPAPAQPTAEEATTFEAAWAQQPRVELGIPADGAKVVIVKFNDYQCPGCRQAHDFYKPILEKFAQSHPGEVKQVVKDWPWDNQCNFNAPTATGHPGACAAAAAVRIARDQSAEKVAEM
ncbi:MAG TPA: vitamin K epoxide reductase family protein [Arenibaculum sp.]|nr:vitamin K epoxide reductase family protein [Arenibaculum sp.]